MLLFLEWLGQPLLQGSGILTTPVDLLPLQSFPLDASPVDCGGFNNALSIAIKMFQSEAGIIILREKVFTDFSL